MGRRPLTVAGRSKTFILSMNSDQTYITINPQDNVEILDACQFIPATVKAIQQHVCDAFACTRTILKPTYMPKIMASMFTTNIQLMLVKGAIVPIRMHVRYVDSAHGSEYTLCRETWTNDMDPVGFMVHQIMVEYVHTFSSEREENKPPLTWQLQFPPYKCWWRHPQVQALMVAVLMGTHSRLGERSPLRTLDENLVKRIAQMSMPELVFSMEELKQLMVMNRDYPWELVEL